MANETPNKNRMRLLLEAFYQEHDPKTYEVGIDFDLSGLLDFTMERGIGVVNRMLLKKYGSAIDINVDLTKKRRKSNIYISRSFSLSLKEKEKKMFLTIENYFEFHNPKIIKIQKFVQFAMIHSIEKLSEKFEKAYGYPITGKEEERINFFNLDIFRLREDIKCFFVEMEDSEQLEVLEETTTWACEIGIYEVDKKFQEIYGSSLNNFNESVGKELHRDNAEEINDMKDLEDIQIEPEFKNMSDVEILCELRSFYEEHDPENISNLNETLRLARKCGRNALNIQLMKDFNQNLKPSLKQKIQLPKVLEL